MDWLKIGSAIFLVMILVIAFPAMRHAMKNSRKANSNEWLGAIIPLALVALFIYLLTKMV